ncbi:MAG: 2-dehydropantoate 2-reductase [Ardenticatenia bacterium]|nr:2-dehydropantoate 2-reductase [Ardenticatenia bacterium]
MDGRVERIHVKATTDVAEVGEEGPVTLALVFVKSYATRRAAHQTRRVLAADGLALTLQNGLGNREVLAEILGEERVVQGVTSHGATVLGPGRVRHAGAGATQLAAPLPELRPRVAGIADLLSDAGIETRLVEDLQALIWGKLIVNVGINPLTAILRVHNGVLAEDKVCRRLVVKAVEEAVAVARALGIPLPYDDPVAHVFQVAKATGANRSSMLVDVLRGTPTEIDVINGAVVREGTRHGVPTPFNAALVEVVKALESTADERIWEPREMYTV